MDQRAWDDIYDRLESDLDAVTTRSRGADVEAELAIILDRARFAIDRGDDVEAIGELQDLQERLAGMAPQDAQRRDGAASALDRLQGLEDELHERLRLGSARLDVVGEGEEEPSRAASRNVKVNRSTAFSDISDEYVQLFETSRVRDEHRSTVRWYSSRILKNRATYEEIERKTGVPWWFTGLLHGMECSFSLSKHLHNGDSLKARTWQVPAGRPKDGSPPFPFVVSACDALDYEGFVGEDDWTIARVLYRLEKYNGFGYRQRFGTVSPYLWSFCNHYVAGKYVKDGVYDPDAVSKQCGTAAALRDLMESGHVSFAAPAPRPKPEPEPKPAEPIVPPSATNETPKPVVGETATEIPATQPAAVAEPPPASQPEPASAQEPVEAPPPTAAAVPSATEAQLTGAGLSTAVAAALATLVDAARPEREASGSKADDSPGHGDDAADSGKPSADEKGSKPQ